MDEILSVMFNHSVYLDDQHHKGKAEEFDDTFSNPLQPQEATPVVVPTPTPAQLATAAASTGRVGGYGKNQRILVVGDGDFSFSLSLAVAFGSTPNLVATSLDSFEFLNENFLWSVWNIRELKGRGCKVLHSVDATQMGNHPELCNIKFDRIIFNFPLAGFFPKDVPRLLQIQVNQSLVMGFMANARNMIEEHGEIHITHKSYGFYWDWNLALLGRSQGLWLREVADFQQSDYPGYHTKYGFGGDRDFDCTRSKTYKFCLMPFDFSKAMPMHSGLGS